MGKFKFKKILREEKNPILHDRRILYPLIILAIITTILNCIIIYRKSITVNQEIKFNMELVYTVVGVYLLLVLPAILVDIASDIKISKMYKKYKNQEDCKDCCKRIKKPIIIISLILGLFAIIILLDLTYCELSGNRPILSVKVNSGEEYIEKYRTFLYDYYKCNDGRKYLKIVGTKFEDDYIVKIGEENIVLKRIEIEKDKVYIGIPSTFIKAPKENINERYAASNFGKGSTECYQNEDGKISFIIRRTEEELKNESVEDFIDYLEYFFDKSFGEYITWGDILIQTIGEDRKVGILEFNMNIPGVEEGNYYCYMWFYSINGKLVINSFDVDVSYEKEWKELGEKIEDTLEFINEK